MPTRRFSRAELAALGVPLADPEEVQYSDTVLADEPVTTMKYTVLRRCVFHDDDGRTYAVTYEAPIDAGDYEIGTAPEGHGWYGDTVEAVEVEQRPVVSLTWQTVTDEPSLDQPRRSALESLTAIYEEAGLVHPPAARDAAARWLAEHAGELVELCPTLLDDETEGR
ncbi:hypothetical protein [Streptomyces sp. DH12]|uniref:hypothetical protein n=1 Tax=Streptomyces sp. DH12 TaxID=2857010 RepID=UPI001E46EC47|nr:hypothetical protein [Streptomyces sp. DH12]